MELVADFKRVIGMLNRYRSRVCTGTEQIDHNFVAGPNSAVIRTRSLVSGDTRDEFFGAREADGTAGIVHAAASERLIAAAGARFVVQLRDGGDALLFGHLRHIDPGYRRHLQRVRELRWFVVFFDFL